MLVGMDLELLDGVKPSSFLHDHSELVLSVVVQEVLFADFQDVFDAFEQDDCRLDVDLLLEDAAHGLESLLLDDDLDNLRMLQGCRVRNAPSGFSLDLINIFIGQTHELVEDASLNYQRDLIGCPRADV
eukprot:CAMPEP_0168343912 /NCGR_PEP_ID=MMETSP0213-20121227/16451_1 /TAXON_ID=151035 /ORGANISM="Euplotes harpa, Strain FSP1.4" /LENGTH=128 /DNA_ID=CAMNT_0008351449 /DNA_START=119 /DNA_END=505 /DNA_ORIENTATION=-